MRKRIVIDASAWLAVLLNEEKSGTLNTLIENKVLVAPDLIRYEAANGILSASRRLKTYESSSPMQFLLKVVADFPIESAPMEAWWSDAVRLAKKHDLTFYDSAYLAVATCFKLPLLTLDKQILEVMRSERVDTV